MDWDCYFMSMAYLVAMKSKDPSTKIGAVVVGWDHEILSVGYNGLPRGLEETHLRNQRPEKYFWYEHAERNSLYNIARVGVKSYGSAMYTQGTPCCDCARAIIQAGVSEVIVHESFDAGNSEKWAEQAKRTREMFWEAEVDLRTYKGPIITTIEGLHDGKKVDLTELCGG